MSLQRKGNRLERKIIYNFFYPARRVSEYLHGVLKKYPAKCLQHTTFGNCKNERCYCKVSECQVGNRPCNAAVLYVRLCETCLLYERVNVEGIGKCNQRIKEYHIVVIAGKAEREYHECIYGYAIWRQSDRYITNSIFAHLVVYVALLAFDHKFVDLLEKQQGHKRVGQLMGELHEPVQIVADSESCKYCGVDYVRCKSRKQSHVIAGVLPAPSYSDAHVNGILAERGYEYCQEQECQQTEQDCGGEVVKPLSHYSPSFSSVSNAAMQ